MCIGRHRGKKKSLKTGLERYPDRGRGASLTIAGRSGFGASGLNEFGLNLCSRMDKRGAVYGGGFLYWWIVVGRPGSRPDPRYNDLNRDDFWIRWADGIYDWQREERLDTPLYFDAIASWLCLDAPRGEA